MILERYFILKWATLLGYLKWDIIGGNQFAESYVEYICWHKHTLDFHGFISWGFCIWGHLLNNVTSLSRPKKKLWIESAFKIRESANMLVLVKTHLLFLLLISPLGNLFNVICDFYDFVINPSYRVVWGFLLFWYLKCLLSKHCIQVYKPGFCIIRTPRVDWNNEFSLYSCFTLFILS